jgi:hypothetical protein
LRRPVERRSAFLLWQMINMIATKSFKIGYAVFLLDDSVVRIQENL